ncbi:MAG: hypothetical protein ACEQSF_00790 [Solirubrobacteraceae bacterium]
MINDYLIPISDSLKDFALNQDDLFSLGKKIKFDFIENSISDKVVLIGICSTGKSVDKLNSFRKEFYKLKFGDWHSEVFDLGNFLQGNSEQDSIFAIKEICDYLLVQKNTRIILVGDQTKQINWQHYALGENKFLKITNIDSKIPIGNLNLPLSLENYLGKLFESDLKIYNYNHIGYQSYYVSYKELELLDQLNFCYYRLGEVYEKIEYFLPTLQNSNSVSINLRAISNYNGLGSFNNGNGFSNREICNLSYFAGLSSELNTFGLYNFSENKVNSLENELVGQMLWYFIEGFNNKQEEVFEINNQIEKYSLPFQKKNIVFFKNKINNKWWAKIGENIEVFPCSLQDYEEAVNNNFTKRIKVYLKK